MASFWSLLGMFIAIVASSSATHQLHYISTISAAPASLPSSPLLSPVTIPAAPSTPPGNSEPHSPSPALSPDISPLLPSPKGEAATPTESSLPIIPSSPSPPNPDDEAAGSPVSTPLVPPGEESAIAESDSVRVEAVSSPTSFILCCLAVYSMQFIGM